MMFQRLQVGELFFESAMDNIVATGSTQATAYKLPLNELNRLTSVAAGTGVMLPASQAGMTIMIVNHGLNNLQVYGQPGDTINDVATASGVSQMLNSWVIYTCFSPGAWYTADLATGFVTGIAGAFATFANSAITASTTHTQGGATPITTMNVGVTVNNAADAVVLPPAQVGMEVTIVNLSASLAMQVYATGSNTIGVTAGSTGVSQAANAVTIYFCFVAGQWVTK